MPLNTGEIRHFRYPYRGYRIYAMLLLMAWASLCIWVPFSQRQGRFGGEIFLISGFAFFFTMLANACFMTSDVEVGADGIARRLLSWQWKEIKWADIDNVRVYRVWNYAKPMRKMYWISRTDGSRGYIGSRGGMSFDENIRGFDELVRIVECQSAKWGFRITGPDGN
jgi:hypothetical protein